MKHHIAPLVLLILATSSPSLRADFVNGQAASSVLGKPSFTDTTTNGPTATATERIEGITLDPNTNKLFVCDRGNNRILRFSSAAAYQTGAAAEAVFGQADFVSGNANRGGTTGDNNFDSPRSIHVDSAGSLWVADDRNHRVLRFDNASNAGNGVAANAVLGQLSFTGNTSGLSQNRMNRPSGVGTDDDGNLYVGDWGNNRVIIFTNAAAKGNGANADRVLGQAGFGTNAGATSAGGMRGPWGCSVDNAGRLWVGDTANNRVLRFDNVASKSNGASADGVLGQTDFTSSIVRPLGPGSLNQPYYATPSSDGTVWVDDYNSDRVLGFKNAASKPNGGNADNVLGQPNFTSSVGPSANNVSIDIPTGIAVDADGSLFVGSYSQNRVMRFSEKVAGKVSLRTAPRVTANGSTVTLRGTSENASFVQFRKPGSRFARAKGVGRWIAKVRNLTKPITVVTVEAVAVDKSKAVKRVRVSNR